MVSSMQQILPIVWNTLTESAALYPLRAACRPASCRFAAEESMRTLWLVDEPLPWAETTPGEPRRHSLTDGSLMSERKSTTQRRWTTRWIQTVSRNDVTLLLECLQTSFHWSTNSPSMPCTAGEVLGFENLVFSIFDFVHTLLENNKFKSTVKKALPDLIYYVILYMQITEEQVRTRSRPRELGLAPPPSACALFCQNWLSAKCSLRSKCGRRTPSSLWRTRTMTLSRTRSGFLPRICWWWDPNPQLSVRPWALKSVQIEV